MKNIFVLFCTVFFLVTCSKQKEQQDSSQSESMKSQEITKISIGTGGLTGVYYPTGGYIAKMVNDKEDVYNLKVTAESTGGSVFNINAILSGNMDFGMVQSDRQYQAYNGLNEWKESGPQKDLRAVFSIHSEAVNLVATLDSKIEKVSDLKGKKVSIGQIGTGTRQNAIDTLQFYGLSTEEDIKADNVKPAESANLIKDRRIDAYFYTVGHPNGSINEVTAGKVKVKIIPIEVDDEMLKKYPYYTKVMVPIKKHYPSAMNENDILQTFGVKATLCTRENVSPDIVYALTKEVFENFDKFKTLHPAYSDLTKEDMLKGLSAPLHDGAMRYYKEVGLDRLIESMK